MTTRSNHTIYGFPAAILDFQLKEASDNGGIGTVEKLVPENMGVAAGILFLSSIELQKPCDLTLKKSENYRKFPFVTLR